MASTNDLDRLKKSAQGIQATNDSNSESFSRDRVINSEEIKTGLSRLNGSWASEYDFGENLKLKAGLGAVGLGDVDFIPYIENSNRIGIKGSPSLGSPIALEVVGPTLKSADLVDWVWSTDISSNFIRLEHNTKTIESEYGIPTSALADYTSDFGGLYVAISYVGSSNESWVSGFSPATATSNIENTPIYKVRSIGTNILYLHGETPLSNDFSVDGHIAGITLLRKKASRMYEVPSSGGTTFFVMPPETTCSLDTEPPLSNWTAGDFTTYSSLSGDSSGITAQNALYYGNRVKTAVPAPYSFGGADPVFPAKVMFDNSTTNSLENGTLYLLLPNNTSEEIERVNFLDEKIGVSNLTGLCIRISKVSYDDNMGSNNPTDAQKNSFLGFYEIVGASGPSGPGIYLVLRSVTNQHHVTGQTTWFNVGGDNYLSVEFTIHRSVSQLLQSSNPLTHEIESARIKSLISPNLNSNSESAQLGSSLMRGGSCTWADNDPSSLSELGFGVVVYPAKLSRDGSSLVADFNNPLSSDLYDVDYEGATVYLKNSYTQSSSVTNHSTNPSKRTVLFISCVALSQSASFGTRFISDGKGAFSLPELSQVLTTDKTSLSDLDNPPAFWSAGTNSVFVPNISIDEIPKVGMIQTIIVSGGITYDLKITYRGVSSSENGVNLNNVLGDFNPYDSFNATPNVGWHILRNPYLTKEQSDLVGSTVRSDTISLSDGSISYNTDGSVSLSIGGLRNDESTLLYNSNTKNWEIDSDSYEVGLEIKRGDLIASNVTELPVDNLEVEPLVLTSNSSYPNEYNQLNFPSLYTSHGITLPELTGYYLNVEGAGIRSKANPTIANGSRVVLGLDFANTKSNPWQSKYVSYTNTGSTIDNSVLRTKLDEAIKSAYPSEYSDGSFLLDSNGCLVLAGRNPSVFPAYSYVSTVSVVYLMEQYLADGYDGTSILSVPNFRYLLSLEEVHGDKWVTVAVNVSGFSFPFSLSAASSNLELAKQNARDLCKALNKDLYFGHSARLLNRAGFYEGFHQDLNTGTGDVTVNFSLQSQINSFNKHTVRGERQVLWITVDDPRHSNYNSVNHIDDVTLEFICTGRGCGKIPFINGAISGDNLKLEAIKEENQLINVVASLGRAEELETKSFFDKLFKDLDHVDYNRIGLYWESTTLPTGTEARDASASGNHLELGFDRNGFLPLGPALGSSRLISYATQYSNLGIILADDLPKSSGRDAGSPIRNRLNAINYQSGGTSYFDVLPFLVNTGSSAGENNVGESFDFLIQDHWLDNPSFSFNSEDDLSQEDLGLFTWVSRDFMYSHTTDLNSISFLGYICTLSANKREFASFTRPLSYPLGHKGYDDIVVSIKSEYFTSDLFSSSVLQKGDEVYFNSTVSSLNRRAKAHITHRSDDGTGAYNLLAILKSVNSQYGGFSESAYYQPRFTFANDVFSSSFIEFFGSNLQTASLISGNNFYWTSGNLRSLINMASIPTQLTSNERTDNRDTSAIDGGFGSFGSLGASLLTGGRLGLFNGLPQKNSGISFASISGGSGLTGNLGGQDIGYDDRYRVFETFLDHGIFPFVSLPSGSGGSYSSTLGSLSRERDKRSDYKSGVFGGNAGLRVSGDIQLFVRNLRILGSDDNTAFVMHTDFAPHTDTDYLIGNSDETIDVSSPFLPYNSTGTGPITSGHQAQKSASGFNYLGLKSQGGGHMPSGVGLFGPSTNNNISDVSVRRTATISLGLTLADLKGISKSLGREVAEPVGDGRQVTANFPDQYGGQGDIGNALFHMAQFSTSEIPTLALPSLRGAYVALSKYKHSSSPNVEHSDNYGIYRVIDTPVLMPVDASDLESGQGSRNTLHGYGSDYTTHTRASLNTIVANIMVRVESDEVRSIYPDPSKANQDGKSIIPTGLVIDKDYYDNTELNRKTNRLGHSWRLLNKSVYGTYTDILIFDVMDQGGSPTSSPSDLFGLELNPRALGKQSFPAEIAPISFTENGNSDVPASLDFVPTTVYTPAEQGSYSSIGLRLLGVHRTMSHKGKTSSLAFVTQAPSDIADLGYEPLYGEEYDGSPYYMGGNLKDRFGDFVGNSPARMVVYSSERSDRLDEVATTTTKRLLENGETGYVSLGYPERFGLGVILDGGLGVVSGNAVRVHPQKGNFDSLGSLTLYSSPMMDSRNDLRDGNAVTLPSRFNRTEFYGDVVVAGHDSDLVIDDARTVDGAYARVNEAQASASTTKNYQSRLLRFGERWSQFGDWESGKKGSSQDYAYFLGLAGIPNTYARNDGEGWKMRLSNYFLNAPPPPLPNDTVLPWVNAGVRVKTSGGVVYERAFRPQDATGADIVASMSKGAKSDRGLRGLEIPAFGECLLLPKGPSTAGGRVYEKDNSLTNILSSIAYGDKSKIRTGTTPTDLPLYEFYNGPARFAYGGNFAITLGNVLQEHGLFEREPSQSNRLPIPHSPKNNRSGSGVHDRVREFDAGILSQAYHHSRSNADSNWGGKNELFLNSGNTNPSTYVEMKTVYVYAWYNSSSFNSNEGFAVFYREKNGRKVYVEIDTLSYWDPDTQTGTASAPLIQFEDAVGNNRPFVASGRASNSPATSSTSLNASGSFEIPNSIDTFYVTTALSTADLGNPDIAVLFYYQATLNLQFGFTQFQFSAGSSYVNPTTPWMALYPDVQTNLESGNTNRYVNKVYYPIRTNSNIDYADWLSPYANGKYNFLNNLTSVQLENEGFTSSQVSDILNSPTEPATSPLQVRLLDGMVLEDITTGTFYTVGDVGRYRNWHSHMKSTSQPNDSFRYSNGGSFPAEYNDLTNSPSESMLRPPIRKLSHGSLIGNNGNTSPEVFYDLSPHFDYEVEPLSLTTSSQQNGFGDIADNGYVRRPLLGHKFRVVPNVEFVPVLGHRSVCGGIAVPYDKETGYSSYISEADAVLYDKNYSFLETDIGRKIYLCGTYEYAYVGWYVIIGIQKDYVINPSHNSTNLPVDTFDVAVVRKIKRSGEYVRTWNDSGTPSLLPLRPQSMKLEASVDVASNGTRKLIRDGSTWFEYTYDIHQQDPFYVNSTAYIDDHYFTTIPSYDGLPGNGSLSYSPYLTGYSRTSALWLGVNVWREDGSNRFYGISISRERLNDVSEQNITNSQELVEFLNTDSNFNGVRLGLSLQDCNQNIDNTKFVGWADYNSSKWIKWSLKYSHQDSHQRYPVFSSQGFLICGITCEIDESVLTPSQKRNVLNRGCFLQVDLQFFPEREDGLNHVSNNKSTLLHDRHSRGFFRLKGVNSNVSIAWGDKNSYYPNQYEAYTNTSTSLSFDYDVERISSNGNYLMGEGANFNDRYSTDMTKSQSATGGLRWVFSAPLLEENVGSYVHLTKPRPYRFGQPTYTQNRQLRADSNFCNPFAWTSGWQRKLDLDNNDPFDLGTDIFRVNRCASTGDIMLGGDCESYAVEDIICRTTGGFTQKGLEIAYAPLSVMGNWPDSETNELPNTGALNYPILYALQPVARERIVTIKPSSFNSSILFAHGAYGRAPMVIPASPLALDTNAVISDQITHSGSGSTQYVNVNINSAEWGRDYVFGERIMMDVSRPWLLMGRDDVSQTYRYKSTYPTNDVDLGVLIDTTYPTATVRVRAVLDQADVAYSHIENGWGTSGTNDTLIWTPQIEAGNTESHVVNSLTPSYNRFNDTSDNMINAIYTWSPAGEWWQIQTPLHHGFERGTFLDETTPPPTLRIDLTDSFTQSSSSGSGLNSPYLGRTPKGERLTRLWVNFGLNGDISDIPGSLFQEDTQEFYDNISDRFNSLGDTTTRTKRESTTSAYAFRKRTNSSITFNLIVELPGSIGNSEDTFFMDRNDTTTDDWSDLLNQEYSFGPIGGSNGSTFGGRAPSVAYNHSNNSTRYSVVDSVSALRGKPRFAGGTIVVPLYVNREAGDMMPNVMERFVTVGPVRFKRDGSVVSDWSIGDAMTGFGSEGNNYNSFMFPQRLDGNDGDSKIGHIRDTSSIGIIDNFVYSDFNINSFSPIVWGGQNFYSTDTTITDYEKVRFGSTVENAGRTITLPDLAVFEDIRSGLVLASSMPRSSRLGGGVMSSFSSGIYSDLGIFSPRNTNFEMALHAPATTGITIAHSAGRREQFAHLDLNSTKGGAFGSNIFEGFSDPTVYLNYKPKYPKSSSHAFMLALTPVGDAFEAPTSHITMPKITSSQNPYADTLYADASGRKFASLGRYGRTLNVSSGTDAKDRRFKVGNWLDKILEYYGIPAQSGSMLPTGARVYLEATVPWATRPQEAAGTPNSFSFTSSNNGAWISSVKCAFEVETADGTAWTLDVNTMGED